MFDPLTGRQHGPIFGPIDGPKNGPLNAITPPRHMFRLPVVLAPGLLLAFLCGPAHSAERPHVIVIYTDDQGFGDAGCLNEESRFPTPHLDQLAREGLSFTDAHCSDTVCTPSRYGLLTGRYNWRTVLKKGVFNAERECLIADGRMTLASLFREHGYHTAMVGKWHLGMDFPGTPETRDWTQPVTDMPLDKGFDYFFGIPASLNYGILAWFEGRYAKVPPTLFTAKKGNQRAIDDYRIRPPYQQSAAATRQTLGKAGFEVAPDFVDADCLLRFTDQAIAHLTQHLQQHPEQPFFLYLPYTSPHKPVIPRAEFRGQGSAGAYGEFMIETDHRVGQLLAFLKSAGIDDNTLIIYSSDNGPENTWRKRIPKFGHHSNGIYREGKRSIYEGGHRVPFFVRWPAGVTRPGRQVQATICQTDVLATCAEILGTKLPATAGEDSHSFLSLLHDDGRYSSRPPTIHHASNGQFAVRDGDWKLVLAHASKRAELYNLASDPSEKQNVIAQHPSIVTRLTARAADIVCRGRSTPGAPQANDTDWWADLTWIDKQSYARQQATAVTQPR